MNIQNTWNNETKIQSIIGLTKSEADELFRDFSEELREFGDGVIGRPPKLTDIELFFMIMFYYRHYPTLEVLSFMFEIDVSNAKRWVDHLEGVLKSILAKKNLSHGTQVKIEKLFKNLLRKSPVYI